MNNLYGAYVWNYVGNEDKVEGISGDHSYIVCVENPTPNGAIWRLHMTKWFFKGDELKDKIKSHTQHQILIRPMMHRLLLHIK